MWQQQPTASVLLPTGRTFHVYIDPCRDMPPEAQKVLDFVAKEFPKEFQKIRFGSAAASPRRARTRSARSGVVLMDVPETSYGPITFCLPFCVVGMNGDEVERLAGHGNGLAFTEALDEPRPHG